MCGYLKRRLKGAKWKKMWFVLKDKVLYAYKASEDTVASETFPLLGYQLDSMTEVTYNVDLDETTSLSTMFLPFRKTLRSTRASKLDLCSS